MKTQILFGAVCISKKICLLVFCIFLFDKSLGQTISFEVFASGFAQPIAIANANDNNLYIAENKGVIKKVASNGTIQSSPFLDITSKINNAYSGIHGLAFHPNYATNGYFFIKYVSATNQNCYISRFSRDPNNPNQALANSELVLLQYPNWTGHQGGNIEFGYDGFLYIATGDGAVGGRGMTGDEFGNAQNLSSVKGKLLRIDVTNGTLAIPASNPFKAAGDNIPDEIIANGLRNPWKFSFDKQTGDLWIGDVGQDSYEEIDYVPNGTFENRDFGWSCYEGSFPIIPSNCSPNAALTFPVFAYGGYNYNGHKLASVTGGYVYRGSQYAALQGWYFCADYASNDFWKIKINQNGSATINNIGKLIANPVAFGEDSQGELYVASLSAGTIYKIHATCSPFYDLATIHTENTNVNAQNYINSSSTVNTQINVNYAAEKYILLSPNFKAESGSTFKAEIKGCN